MRAAEALAALAAAYADPAAVVARLRGEGRRVMRVLGSDAPTERVAAAGFVPVRLVAGGARSTPRADAVMGNATMGVRGRRLLEQLLDPAHADVPVLFTRADAEQPQIFAALRELARLGEPAPRAIHLLDWLHFDRESSRAYTLKRLAQLETWLGQIGEPITSESSDAAEDDVIAAWTLIAQLDALRTARPPRLSGADLLRTVGSAAILPAADFIHLAHAILDDADDLLYYEGPRVFVSGSAHEDDALYAAIGATGALIVGEDHRWGTLPGRVPLPAQAAAKRAQELIARVAATGADRVLHVTIDGDEAAAWDAPAIRAACAAANIPFTAVRTPMDPGPAFADALAGRPPERAPSAPRPTAARPPQRSRKSLASVATFGTYQREWFASVRQAVAEGAPFAVVNANAPQEILRALGISFVVNQWWASIVAAKQQSGRYRALLRDAGLPTDVEAYSAQGIAAALDADADQAPWGGLPRPDFLYAIASSDPTARIFDEWASRTGAATFVYERTVDPRLDIPTRWWEGLPDRWDEALEPERLDLLVAEIEQVVAQLETATGRTLSRERLVEVMDLVNEQEDYYRRTRDLIARTVPAPIGIVDSMPATMVPQWHRGTEWARDAAKDFYDEVAERVANGAAAIPNERVRLMWVGRGLWSDMAFFQRWEESHGAVFVWSMYLALAADGYIRRFDRGRGPMRALAARFLTMGDELRMPSWAGPWHVHEAQTHSVDGAVAADDADPFVLRALAAAGVPVLELGVDNYALDEAGQDSLDARISAFIEGPATARAQTRARQTA